MHKYNTRRNIIKASVGAGAVALAGCLGDDETDYPGDTIEIVVPFPEGGGVDLYVREYEEGLSNELGVPLSVSHIDGAGGLRGATEVYESEPDGYRLLGTAPPTEITAATENPPGWEYSEFTGVASLGFIGTAIVTHDDYEVEDLTDLAERFQNDEFSNVGTTGGGALESVIGPILRDDPYGLEYENMVGYGGSGETIQGVLSGEIEVGFTSTTPIPEVMDEGIDPVCVLLDERSPLLPDVPSISADFGYPDIGPISSVWIGLLAPPETPQDRASLVADAIESTAQSDELQEWHEESGFDITVEKTEDWEDIIEEMQDVVAEHV